MTRLTPRPIDELTELQPILEGVKAAMGFVPTSMLTMAHMPQLTVAFSLLASTVFLGLTALSAQTPNTPAVAVGGPVIDFTAPADDGTLFDSGTLRGRPFLLKFFRGHW